MFSLPVEENLELRYYELHHAALLFNLIDQSRVHLRRYLGFVDQTTLLTLEDFIRRSREKYAAGMGCNFGIWLGDRLVGNIGLFDINSRNQKCEIGYWLGQPFCGHGIMTKAVSSLLSYAFGELGLNRVQLCCATDNRASRRIAQRLGFSLEGIAREDRDLRGTRVSHEVWAVLKKDWHGSASHFAKSLGDGAQLRLLEARHAEALFAVVDTNRPHLRRYLPWVDSNTTLEYSQNFIKTTLEQFKNFDGLVAGIWQDWQFAGVLGMHFIDWQHRDTEFGYWLAEPFTGRGLATRASKAVLDYIFLELNLQRVTIAHALENTASQKVIERLGFVPETITKDAEKLNGRFHDWQKYSLLRREWR